MKAFHGKKSTTSKMKTHAEIESIIDILFQWHAEDKSTRTKFRKENPTGCAHDAKFELMRSKTDGKMFCWLKQKNPETGMGRIIAVEEIFDAIHVSH
jgi:hypothetical protein